jgi:hypothetical protein
MPGERAGAEQKSHDQLRKEMEDSRGELYSITTPGTDADQRYSLFSDLTYADTLRERENPANRAPLKTGTEWMPPLALAAALAGTVFIGTSRLFRKIGVSS